ncbi:hypothetical protein YYC_00762 [Plasmodium yoelii 17X]|uniref:Uncharacterized protein n=1 Tax=Plasmodium yoelii 17X TaxID=1323249 RepID=V7PX22_PLAYE|nr:hypothetical protein YYC_00762 [Plasmodium yoelii 17X]
MNKTKLISAKEVSEVVSWYTHACAGSMQGRRSTDEDATVILASLKNFESCRHVGKDTALFCARNAANFIGNCKSLDIDNITKACIQMDKEILRQYKFI